jgi:radical SAM/Cys-rich protein
MGAATMRHFCELVGETDPAILQFDTLRTLQVNLGNLCNQRCRHCHVGAGPDGKKVMSRGVMERVLAFLQGHAGLCVDITGGCPEMNPAFRWFVESAVALCESMIVRTNLTVLLEPGMDWVAPWYAENGVRLVASMPCYTQKNVDAQRGDGVFDKSIVALRILNCLGYGEDSGLELDLVYNPGGDFLPGRQDELQADYKMRLAADFGVTFGKLFTITNAPVGRFRSHLESSGRLEPYLRLLRESYNPAAAAGIMCRSLVSVGYNGVIYNCDFNQALGLPLIDESGRPVTIESLDAALSQVLSIITGSHCFCCTAGAGSSCTGALASQG